MTETEQPVEIRFFGGERLTLQPEGVITHLIIGDHKLSFSPDGLDYFMDIMKARHKAVKKRWR